jgi:hypothetical protein
MTTWYVRPNISHSGTRNGTSYATAWGGWSEIVWGVGGVRQDDTLYVCGTHARSATVDVGNHLGTSGHPCTIRGDYPGDPGSFVFTGAYFFNNYRSYTTLHALTFVGGTSNCVYGSGTLAGMTFQDCTFVAAAKSALSFGSGNGTSYTDILIDGCTFTGDCRDGATTTGAINWFVATAAAVSVITRMTITNNTFRDLFTGRAAIHFRVDTGAGVATAMHDVVVTGNTFTRMYGIGIELSNGFSTYGTSDGLIVSHNTFTDLYEVIGVAGLGGCIRVWGFVASAALGRPLIEHNYGERAQGATGLVNVFWGAYTVRRNIGREFSTTGVDANGITFDFGVDDAIAYQNEFYDLPGRAGIFNSGVGIMVLDSQNVTCWGNLTVRCKVGVHIGAGPTAQSCSIVGNTFIDCSLYGIDLLSTADEANCVVKNNVFTAASGTAVSVRNAGGAWSGDDYNAFHGFAAASGHTLGAHDVTSDPLLSPSYRPLPGSPLIGAGTYIAD